MDDLEAIGAALARATELETFARMLKDPEHGGWECVALDYVKQPTPAEPRVRKAVPMPYRLDTTLGYGKVARTIHYPKTARLFFK